MENIYQIPLDAAELLENGLWVEILEAVGDKDAAEVIHVKKIRIDGKRLFSRSKAGKGGGRSIKPHEGRVVYLDRGESGARFTISFSACS